MLGLLAVTCGAQPAAAPASPTTTASAVNLTGTLDRGPSPTCPAGEPCDPPNVAARLVFTRGGGAGVVVAVRPDGSFALHLDPGDWAIAAQPPPFHARLEPSSVRVPVSGSVELRLRIVSSGS